MTNDQLQSPPMLVKGITIAAAALCFACATSTAAHAAADPKTWEYGGGGKWKDVDTPRPAKTRPSTTQSQSADEGYIADPQLDRAEHLIVQKENGVARDLIAQWFKQNPHALNRDRALFLAAQAANGKGDGTRAFYYLDELMDEYPESTLFGPALELQYRIADSYLLGRKDRLFLMPLLSRSEEAIEMLFRIQERSPGSPVAERSLLRTAEYYYATAEYDLAYDAFGAYTRSYPRSPDVTSGYVPLKQAWSSWAQFRGLDFDSTPLIDARAQLEDVQKNYPETAQRNNVAEQIARIDGILAAKMFRRADFFTRTSQPRAAAITYQSIVKQYPDSPEAAKSKLQLARLPAAASNKKQGDAPIPPQGTDVAPGGVVPGPDVR